MYTVSNKQYFLRRNSGGNVKKFIGQKIFDSSDE
jgi:hypothetical protein